MVTEIMITRQILTRHIDNTWLRTIAEWIVASMVAGLLFFFVHNYVFRIADVNGYSMEPTLSHGDLVILSRLGYLFGEPQPGDIIAFPFRGSPSEFYIKRIIGGPGDIVDFQDDRFIINGQAPDYDFAQVDILSPGDVDLPMVIAEGDFFVLGDNLNASKDSRYRSVGSIPEEDMVGRVVIRFWPPSRFGPVQT